MTSDDHWPEISRQFATLTEQVLGLRRDIERQDQTFAEETENSHASRRELYEKVNTVAQDVAVMKGDVKVAGIVAAQARDTVTALQATVEAAAPTISDMQSAKRFGVWIIGGGGAAAIGSGLAALAWGEQLKAFVLHWLGLGK